ncbi:MAG: hypothetical protein K2K47_08985 [Duncaniella sp.]|nr:hypothetical protein [Duncaniella sp.]
MFIISKKNLQSLTAALCAAIVLLAAPSCDKDDNYNDEFEVISSGSSADEAEVEEVTLPTAIIDDAGVADEDLKKCFTNIVDPQAAKIILIDSRSIGEYESLLSEAYAKGVLIAVLNADGKVVADWSERNDIFYAGPEEDETCAIYGFNNRGTYYSINDSSTDNGIIEDDDVPLFHFCGWVNNVAGNRFKGTDLRTKDIKKRFSPQSVTHTFKVVLDEKAVTDARLAEAGQLALTTTANVSLDIYPLHVFDGNAPGDYYFIEAEMVLHNAPLDNGTWLRRRGNEETQISGMFLNRFDMSAGMMRKSAGTFVEDTSHRFAAGSAPAPASAADASAYNPGSEWTIDATVSGGIPDSKDNHKLTVFNNWIWSNSSEAALPGIEIKNNSTAADVAYSLVVNALSGEADNSTMAPVPEMAKGDITFKCSWIWYAGNVDENLYMQVDINPVYQAYQRAAGGKMTIAEFEKAVPGSKTTFRFPLTPPNRVATSSAVLRNSAEASYYVSDIKMWCNKATDAAPDYVVPQTISTPSATGGSGVSAVMLILPAGDYTIEGTRYSVENGVNVNEQVITNRQPITLTPAGNTTIDLGSALFTVK